jgi:hypothetical protein
MKFSTRMFLMTALLSVSFLASASPPAMEPTAIDIDQVSLVAVAADTAVMPALHTEEEMPMLQRVASQDEQRLCGPTAGRQATAHQRCRLPYVTTNSCTWRHTQHRT